MDDVTAAKLAPEAKRIRYEAGATGDRHAVQDDIGNVLSALPGSPRTNRTRGSTDGSVLVGSFGFSDGLG